MGRKKHYKKKVYLSNVDVINPKTAVAKVIRSNTAESVASLAPITILKQATPQQVSLLPQVTTCCASKYELPELFSSLALTREVERLKKLQNVASGQLTPKSKKELNTKITKSLNYQPETLAYKKLTPVNVNNEELLHASKGHAAPKAKYESKNKKDREPKLSDYLKPDVPFAPNDDISPFSMIMNKKEWNNFDNIMRIMSMIDGDLQRGTG